MKPKEMKDIRESFDFTQKIMANVLGMHPSAFQQMEYGTRPIPEYIEKYAKVLPLLNENKLFRKHLATIGVDLNEKDDDDT